jgi:hypothetical protein
MYNSNLYHEDGTLMDDEEKNWEFNIERVASDTTYYSLSDNYIIPHFVDLANEEEKTKDELIRDKILMLYDVDIAVEKFIFPYLKTDANGDYIVRAFEAYPYDIIYRDGLAHRTLNYVAQNPGHTHNKIKKATVGYGYNRKKLDIESIPVNRLAASGLLTMTSKFYGYATNKKYILPPAPRFLRTYTITDKGREIIKIFDTTDKKSVYPQLNRLTLVFFVV